ncbi:hypothetical protein RRK63_001457 [Vibrio fluvialis]|nr:hypothetical protein [Vibrio fluvialis]
MSNFLFIDKDNFESKIPSEDAIRSVFSELHDEVIYYYESNRFIICFPETRTVKFHKDEERLSICLGAAVYENKEITTLNLANALDRLNDQSNYSDLSGRYLIIDIDACKAKLITSIFASFPHYVTLDKGMHCSSQYVISKLFNYSIDNESLIERCLYHCNYRSNFFSSVERSKPSVIYYHNKMSVDLISYLSGLIKQHDNIDIAKASRLISERMESLIKVYSENKSKLSISLSGGRDSRLLLCQLLKVLDKDSISLYTVGRNDDIEYSLGKKFSSNYEVSHNVYAPCGLNENNLASYAKKISNINFPVQYKSEFIEYLKEFQPALINTAIPETVLCHMHNFDGDNHPAVNFIRNRSTILESNYFKDGELISKKVEDSAMLIWKELRKSLPNDSITNIFFELTTFQRDWVYNILRISDYAGETICVMEDPEILSILSSIDKKWLSTDDFYELIIKEHYKNLYDVPTTRDLTPRKMLNTSPKYLFRHASIYFNCVIKVASLGYLTASNEKFMKRYIIDNHNELSSVFTEDYLQLLLNKLSTRNFSTNRVVNFLKRRFSIDRYLSEYELIIPTCLISLIKAYK